MTTGYTTRAPVQLAATAVGVVFVLVGVLGFVPGVTTDFNSLTLAGHESGALLLGVFAVSVLHNIVHLLFGVVGLAMARTAAGARSFLIGGGVIYLEAYAKASLKKYRPMAARNEDKKVFSGLL